MNPGNDAEMRVLKKNQKFVRFPFDHILEFFDLRKKLKIPKNVHVQF